MSYILNIHTTSENAIVNLSSEKQLIDTIRNDQAKEHAAFLHVAIKNILEKNGVTISDLVAVGVTGGPGSYTGIRIGLATAKGLCFGLNIPLMIFNTLELMAFSAVQNIDDKSAVYCPMIDARRMEVFAALYHPNLQTELEPSAMKLDTDSVSIFDTGKAVYFFGSGSEKFEKILNNKPANFIFRDEELTSEAFAEFSRHRFENKKFENVLIAEPIYLKEFYTTAKN